MDETGTDTGMDLRERSLKERALAIREELLEDLGAKALSVDVAKKKLDESRAVLADGVRLGLELGITADVIGGRIGRIR